MRNASQDMDSLGQAPAVENADRLEARQSCPLLAHSPVAACCVGVRLRLLRVTKPAASRGFEVRLRLVSVGCLQARRLQARSAHRLQGVLKDSTLSLGSEQLCVGKLLLVLMVGLLGSSGTIFLVVRKSLPSHCSFSALASTLARWSSWTYTWRHAFSQMVRFAANSRMAVSTHRTTLGLRTLRRSASCREAPASIVSRMRLNLWLRPAQAQPCRNGPAPLFLQASQPLLSRHRGSRSSHCIPIENDWLLCALDEITTNSILLFSLT